MPLMMRRLGQAAIALALLALTVAALPLNPLILILPPSATTPLLLADLLGAALTPQMFGAKGDNSNDDTAALKAWAASASSGKALACPAGNYLFKDTIDFGSGKYHVSIKCSGSVFYYTGTDTTKTLFTAGATAPNGCSDTDWVFEDFSVKSNTVMTAGDAFKLSDFCASELRNISVGRDLNGDQRLWNGLHFNGGNSVHYKGSGASARNVAMIVNGDPKIQFTDFWFDGGVLLTSGTGLVIGGNVAFNAISGDILENHINVLIDQSQVPAPNIQVFFGPNIAIDATTGAPDTGILVNDPGFSNSYLYFEGTWVASARGNCIVINGDQWQVNYTGGNVGNCGATGYYQSGNHVHANFVGTYIWGNQYGLTRKDGTTGTLTACGIRADRNRKANTSNVGSSCAVP